MQEEKYECIHSPEIIHQRYEETGLRCTYSVTAVHGYLNTTTKTEIKLSASSLQHAGTLKASEYDKIGCVLL